MEDLILNSHQINEQLARYGVKFGIYKNGVFNERLFPYIISLRFRHGGEKITNLC